MFFFFFQAEDGIRDYKVTGFRRVLFRSVMTGVAIAKAGSANDTTLALAPNDYYAVVVDFAGVPTRYSLCIGFPSTPLSPRCAILAAATPVPPSAAQLQASVMRRSRLEAAIARRGLRLAPLRSPARRQ